jgi:hypothetical protein
MLKGFFAALATCAAFASPAYAHSVRQLQLDEMISSAGVAFEGTVIESHSATDAASHRIVTFTTFAVRDVLKGNVGSTHTIKQLGGELPAEGRFYKVDLRTHYVVGQNVVVFLYGESSLGFSSPVGTAQGSFNVVEDEAGPAVANGRDFGELTKRMAADQGVAKTVARTRGNGKKMGLDDFKQLVRSQLGAAK